ncbi:MAG: hypothetical protein H7832_13680 [Magnetococcus sp. DMHC-6]
MTEIIFKVLGPNKKPIDVIFRKDGKNMSAICPCMSGVDEICQHRINILSGSTVDILSNNKDDVKKVTSWISGTDVGRAMHDLLHATKILRNATEDFNDARKRLGKAMRD